MRISKLTFLYSVLVILTTTALLVTGKRDAVTDADTSDAMNKVLESVTNLDGRRTISMWAHLAAGVSLPLVFLAYIKKLAKGFIFPLTVGSSVFLCNMPFLVNYLFRQNYQASYLSARIASFGVCLGSFSYGLLTWAMHQFLEEDNPWRNLLADAISLTKQEEEDQKLVDAYEQKLKQLEESVSQGKKEDVSKWIAALVDYQTQVALVTTPSAKLKILEGVEESCYALLQSQVTTLSEEDQKKIHTTIEKARVAKKEFTPNALKDAIAYLKKGLPNKVDFPALKRFIEKIIVVHENIPEPERSGHSHGMEPMEMGPIPSSPSDQKGRSSGQSPSTSSQEEMKKKETMEKEEMIKREEMKKQEMMKEEKGSGQSAMTKEMPSESKKEEKKSSDGPTRAECEKVVHTAKTAVKGHLLSVYVKFDFKTWDLKTLKAWHVLYPSEWIGEASESDYGKIKEIMGNMQAALEEKSKEEEKKKSQTQNQSEGQKHQNQGQHGQN